MESTVKQRLIEYLKYKKISKTEFGRLIGVSSAFVTSMRTSIQPDKIQSIVIKFPDLNTIWLLTGEGEMLTTPSAIQAQPNDGDVITIPKEVWGVIKSQADSLQSRDKQIDDLIRLLREQMDEAKRGHVRREDNAGSADAV